MHPDYFHNPPNILPPPLPPPHPPRPRINKRNYFLILFVNSRNIDEKGQAIIYRRKTLDMLFDLIADIDEQYYHTMYDSNDLVFLDKETRDLDVYYRIVYTDKIQDLYKYINPNGYIVKFDWQDIPNTNYPNQFHVHPWPFPHRHGINTRPKPIGAPPLPKDYVGTQHSLSNEYIERFGDDEDDDFPLPPPFPPPHPPF